MYIDLPSLNVLHLSYHTATQHKDTLGSNIRMARGESDHPSFIDDREQLLQQLSTRTLFSPFTTMDQTAVDPTIRPLRVVIIGLDFHHATARDLVSEWFPHHYSYTTSASGLERTTAFAECEDSEDLLSHLLRAELLHGRAYLLDEDNFIEVLGEWIGAEERSRSRLSQRTYEGAMSAQGW